MVYIGQALNDSIQFSFKTVSKRTNFLLQKMENDFKGKTYVVTGAGRGLVEI